MSDPPENGAPELPVGEIRFASEFEPNTLIYEADPAEAPKILEPATPTLSVAGRIAHFRITGKVGEGGMGTIFLATDEYLQRTVALKVIGGKGKQLDPELTPRLLREARAASRINHPNVVTIYAAGEADGHAFIAMEYVAGRELAKIIGSSGLDTLRALDIARQIAEGLGAAHQRGIVHRDVKPANVLVSAGDRVKILDFGLAKARRAVPVASRELPAESAIAGISDSEDALGFYHTRAGVIWGSLRYMPPEQFNAGDVDARSDVYSLGVVLYQMLTGRLPYYAKRPREQLIEILRTDPPPIRNFRLRTPEYVQAIVTRALARAPEDRYRDGDALAADLRTAYERMASFGDAEFELSPSESVARLEAPDLDRRADLAEPTSAAPLERAVGEDRVISYPRGSEYERAIVSRNLYPWTRRGHGAASGTAVRIDDAVFELVAVDTLNGDLHRYFFAAWRENAVIRRVVDYDEPTEAAYRTTRRSSVDETRRTRGVLGGIFNRRTED